MFADFTMRAFASCSRRTSDPKSPTPIGAGVPAGAILSDPGRARGWASTSAKLRPVHSGIASRDTGEYITAALNVHDKALSLQPVREAAHAN